MFCLLDEMFDMFKITLHFEQSEQQQKTDDDDEQDVKKTQIRSESN